MATGRYRYSRSCDGSLTVIPESLEGVFISVSLEGVFISVEHENNHDQVLKVCARLDDGSLLISKYFHAPATYKNLAGKDSLDEQVLDEFMDHAIETMVKDMLYAWKDRAALSGHLVPMEDAPRYLNWPGLSKAARDSLERRLA